MSSSIDISSMTIEQLTALKAQYDSEIKSRGKEASSGKVAKTKRAGSERGTAWASFTKKVVAEHQEEYATFKEAAGDNTQGIAPKFVSHYRSTHEAEWEAYNELWKRENPIASENASVASGGSAEPAAKKPRAKKVAEKIEGQVAHFEQLKEKKKRGPKKVSSAEAEVKAAAPVSLALPAPVEAPTPAPASDEDEEGVELLPFVLDGQTYQRPKSGDEWASGDLWYTNADGSKGSYLGELMDDGSINTDAEEPTFE